jgi:hypothetical protein
MHAFRDGCHGEQDCGGEDQRNRVQFIPFASAVFRADARDCFRNFQHCILPFLDIEII